MWYLGGPCQCRIKQYNLATNLGVRYWIWNLELNLANSKSVEKPAIFQSDWQTLNINIVPRVYIRRYKHKVTAIYDIKTLPNYGGLASICCSCYRGTPEFYNEINWYIDSRTSLPKTFTIALHNRDRRLKWVTLAGCQLRAVMTIWKPQLSIRRPLCKNICPWNHQLDAPSPTTIWVARQFASISSIEH